MNSPRIRTVIADDHPAIVELLPQALSTYGIDCVGTTDALEEVFDLYERVLPDVLVMDVRFTGRGSGLEEAAKLREVHAEAKIVFYSQFEQDELIYEAYRLGGRSFVNKHRSLEDLATAIKVVHEGELHFFPEIAKRMATIGVYGVDSPRAKLDERELTVFKLLARGKSIQEIADATGWSHKTIALIAPQIKEKLGVQRPADLTLLAVRHDLIDLGSAGGSNGA